MKLERFNVGIKVTPHSVFHGAQADRLQAMIASDEVISSRIRDLALRAQQPKQEPDPVKRNAFGMVMA